MAIKICPIFVFSAPNEQEVELKFNTPGPEYADVVHIMQDGNMVYLSDEMARGVAKKILATLPIEVE